MGILQLEKTQDQLSETLAANEAAALADMMKVYYDAKNLYYINATSFFNLPKDQDTTLPMIMLSSRGQDFSNAINFSCALRRDGRLGRLENDFIDRVVEPEAKFYEKFRRGRFGYQVNLSMCNWE